MSERPVEEQDQTLCDDCGKPILLVWTADNDYFNEITGTVGVGMFCPACFDAMAIEKGKFPIWYVGFPEQRELIQKLADAENQIRALRAGLELEVIERGPR